VVWYGMVNVDLYSVIITKVSNALVHGLCADNAQPVELQADTHKTLNRG